MQKYSYVARDERGKVIKGIMIAENDVELANKISNLGYFLTNFKLSEDTAAATKLKTPEMKPKEVIQFTIQLATLIDAGLPLLEGLRDLAREAANERIQRIIDDIRYRVESGNSLKDALSSHPKSFSRLYLAIIGAGETSGNLAQVLNDLCALLEWQMELRTKIKEAATYPTILFCVMVGVVTLLVVKVIPAFEPIFEQAGVDLPLPTKLVLDVSHFVRDFWYILVGGSILTFLGYKFYNATEKGHYRIDSLKLRMPLFGQLLRKIALSRFTHTFALGFKAGINLLTCLDIARDTSGNARIQRAIEKARDSVNVGEKLATSLQMTGEFSPMVVRMIGVGEQTGALSQSLLKVGSFYDKEVASTVKRIFTLIEPIMIVIMGVVVGGIALSVFLPMFKLAQIIGG